MASHPHNIRIPDELWQAAQKEARRLSSTNNVNFSTTSLVIDAMRKYLSIPASTVSSWNVDATSTSATIRPEGPWSIEEGKGPDTGSATAPVQLKPKPSDDSGSVSLDEPFGQAETPIATDEATAVITRRVTTVKPKRPIAEQPAKRAGQYSASELADIDAERLARMKPKGKK